MPIRKNNIDKKVKKAFTNIERVKLQRALTKIGAVVLARADQYAPIDTKALINSGFRVVEQMDERVRLTVGYTQEYALYLHEAPPGAWQPRPPGSPGKRTGGYNPNATPDWLGRGLDESRATINRIFEDELK